MAANTIDVKKIKFGKDGLVPVVVQDYESGEVLMLVYMNAEAVQKHWSAEVVIPVKSLGEFSTDDLRFNILRNRVKAKELQSWGAMAYGQDTDSYGFLHLYTPADAHDQQRIGGFQKKQIRHFAAIGSEGGRDLFAVYGQFVFDQPQPGGDIAVGSRRLETGFNSVDQCGHGAAAGVANDGKSLRIGFRSFKKQIHTADGIPDAPGAHIVADGKKPSVQQIVFTDILELFQTGKAEPFPLTDGIRHQNHIPFAAERDANGLIFDGSFAIERMTEYMEQCGRFARLSIVRNIEIGSDGEIRAAVIDQFFKAVGVPFDGAAALNVQRTLCFRKSVDGFDFFFQGGNIGVHILRRFQCGKFFFADLSILTEFADVILLNGAAEV